jgi:hypothetical protein
MLASASPSTGRATDGTETWYGHRAAMSCRSDRMVGFWLHRHDRATRGRSVQRTLGGRCLGLVQVSALRDMVGVAAVATELVSFIDWPVR